MFNCTLLPLFMNKEYHYNVLMAIHYKLTDYAYV